MSGMCSPQLARPRDRRGRRRCHHCEIIAPSIIYNVNAPRGKREIAPSRTLGTVTRTWHSTCRSRSDSADFACVLERVVADDLAQVPARKCAIHLHVDRLLDEFRGTVAKQKVSAA